MAGLSHIRDHDASGNAPMLDAEGDFSANLLNVNRRLQHGS